jgi:hypothetical protein
MEDSAPVESVAGDSLESKTQSEKDFSKTNTQVA